MNDDYKCTETVSDTPLHNEHRESRECFVSGREFRKVGDFCKVRRNLKPRKVTASVNYRFECDDLVALNELLPTPYGTNNSLARQFQPVRTAPCEPNGSLTPLSTAISIALRAFIQDAPKYWVDLLTLYAQGEVRHVEERADRSTNLAVFAASRPSPRLEPNCIFVIAAVFNMLCLLPSETIRCTSRDLSHFNRRVGLTAIRRNRVLSGSGGGRQAPMRQTAAMDLVKLPEFKPSEFLHGMLAEMNDLGNSCNLCSLAATSTGNQLTLCSSDWAERAILQQMNGIAFNFQSSPKQSATVIGADVAPNTIQGRGAMTMAALVEHFRLTEMTDQGSDYGRSWSTCHRYESCLRCWIEPRWGNEQLNAIKAPMVEAWLRSLTQTARGVATESQRKPLAPATKAKIRNLMGVLFNHAIRWGFTERNPITGPSRGAGVRQGSKRQRIPDVLEVEEMRSIMEHLRLRERVLLSAGFGEQD